MNSGRDEEETRGQETRNVIPPVRRDTHIWEARCSTVQVPHDDRERNRNRRHLRLLLALDRRGDGKARGQESGGARHTQSKGREQELHDEGGGVWMLWFWCWRREGRRGEACWWGVGNMLQDDGKASFLWVYKPWRPQGRRTHDDGDGVMECLLVGGFGHTSLGRVRLSTTTNHHPMQASKARLPPVSRLHRTRSFTVTITTRPKKPLPA